MIKYFLLFLYAIIPLFGWLVIGIFIVKGIAQSFSFDYANFVKTSFKEIELKSIGLWLLALLLWPLAGLGYILYKISSSKI